MLTLPYLILILSGAVINSLHPMLLGVLPLLVGSMLGNELPLHRAQHGAAVFIVTTGLLWGLLGVAIAFLVHFAEPSWGYATVAALAVLLGIFEIKTAISTRAPRLELSEKSWRKLRKHAYRLTRPYRAADFALHAFMRTAGFLVLPLATSLILVDGTPASSAIVIGLYATMLVIPFAFLAALPARQIKLSVIRHRIASYSPQLHFLQALLLLGCGWALAIKASGQGAF